METLMVVTMALVAYLLPAFIAQCRRTKTRGSATVVNIFLGWTFLGWVIAIAMAFGPTEPADTGPDFVERLKRAYTPTGTDADMDTGDQLLLKAADRIDRFRYRGHVRRLTEEDIYKRR